MAGPNAPGAMNQPQKNGAPVAFAIKPGMPIISRADIDDPHFFDTDAEDTPLANQRYILVATDRVKRLNGREVYINIGARLTGTSAFRASSDTQTMRWFTLAVAQNHSRSRRGCAGSAVDVLK
ncbi:unnamed protein product [Zymoseptoria tritici ST99CH_3D1]|uniref:Uncharacterized protein n=1 Tax=Zymoseptoria tritici ST99CH_1E4 TaxID=1276532 RepID=A0A2H1H5E6_ZYMTR|nr:unnamed protein product [Zymoseptoria tritici ST99CH_1E4]SMR64188.1 unnamed protein product [Zymoseptoria tritici ST99CH_3D1]